MSYRSSEFKAVSPGWISWMAKNGYKVQDDADVFRMVKMGVHRCNPNRKHSFSVRRSERIIFCSQGSDTSCPFLKVLIWVSKYNIFGPYTQTPCALLGCEIESKIFISCLRASLTSNMKSQSIRCQKSAWDPSGSFPGMSDRQCEISQN